MTRISRLDWNLIESRVENVKAAHSFKTRSIAFLAIVMEQIYPEIQTSFQECIVDGPGDAGVDAIHIIENDQYAEINIFQSKYRDSFAQVEKTVNDSEVMKTKLFLENLFNKSARLTETGNFRLGQCLRRIWSLHEAGKICKYNVIFCSNGGGYSSTAREIIAAVCDENAQIAYEFYGASDVIKGMVLNRRVPQNGSLRVIGKEIFERSDGDVRGAIASIEAASFVDLIKDPSGSGVKRNIFDDNLRVFLGTRGGYNASIIATANSAESHLFWYLNNGITITCKNFTYNKSHPNPTIVMSDFQIVNGAQTSHSLFEASRSGGPNLENVIIMVRVYATERVDVAERVAVATNSQARIQNRDLKANHPVMKKFEISFLERGYYFERKRNMMADRPEEKRIDALKLGQIILSYDLHEPDRARAESDEIFDRKFEQIFHERRDIDGLVSLFELYRIIEQRRDSYQRDYGDIGDTGNPRQYLVYGHWFVIYVCRLLLIKQRVEDIPTGKAAEALVEQALNIVSTVCGQQKTLAHYLTFRSPKTKDRLHAYVFGEQLSLFDYWSAL